MAEPMTITIDPQRQQQIERYCALSGVNKDKAMEELWNLWENLIYHPWSVDIKKDKRKQNTSDLAWFDEMRAKAERRETPEMSMEEIIEEIKNIRAERREKDGKL
jgi:folylpolyglutamate synthase/dihydropteroate synthase